MLASALGLGAYLRMEQLVQREAAAGGGAWRSAADAGDDEVQLDGSETRGLLA